MSAPVFNPAAHPRGNGVNAGQFAAKTRPEADVDDLDDDRFRPDPACEQEALDVLAGYRGRFADGYDAADIDDLDEALPDGFEVAVVWSKHDDDGFYGDSELLLRSPCTGWRDLPPETQRWLFADPDDPACPAPSQWLLDHDCDVEHDMEHMDVEVGANYAYTDLAARGGSCPGCGDPVGPGVELCDSCAAEQARRASIGMGESDGYFDDHLEWVRATYGDKVAKATLKAMTPRIRTGADDAHTRYLAAADLRSMHETAATYSEWDELRRAS